MNDPVLLKADGLCKSFGAIRVLHDVGFEVRTNEVLGVLGPNGAGKTTLFNMISGDLRLDAGELMFSGVALRHEPPYKRCQRGIGRTYQIPKPYGAMTTFENLLVAAMFGASRSERDAYDHCAAILDDCGLGDKANVPAGALTLLNRKRLEMARALATDPKLLLLDEIAGGLTEGECRALVATIRGVHEKGIAVIWIEHVLHALNSVVERLLVLHFGKVLGIGAPDDIMASREVREIYLGIDV